MEKIKKITAPFSLALLLGVIVFTASYIMANGLVRHTLLGEFFADDQEFTNYISYKEHFNTETDLTLLFSRKDQEEMQTNDFLSVNNQARALVSGLAKGLFLDDIGLPSYANGVVSNQKLIASGKVNRETLQKWMGLESLRTLTLSPDNQVISLKFDLLHSERDQVELDMQTIYARIKHVNSDYKIEVFGVEPFRYALFEQVKQSYLVILPLIALIIAMIILIIFKHWSYLLYAGFSLGLSFAATVSIVYLLEGAVSSISSFSLLFVFVIGTSDIVHFFNSYQLKKNLQRALEHSFKPCLYTSLTTLIGIGTLIFSPLKTLHLFGVYSSIGIILCFWMVFIVLPWVLEHVEKWIPLKQVERRRLEHESYWVGKNRKIKKIIFYSLLSLLTIGSMLVRFDDDFLKKFTSDHPITQAMSTIQTHFGYNHLVEISYDVRNVQNHQQKLKDLMSIEGVKAVYSESGIKKDISKLIADESVASKLSFYTSQLLRGLFTSKVSAFTKRILIKADAPTNKKLEQITIQLQKIMGDSYKLEGFTLLRLRYFERLKWSFLFSGMISLVLIFLFFLYFLKSFKNSLIAMMVNIFPIVGVVSIMGLMGASADLNLPIICAVLIGIGVDDTIHFFFHREHLHDNCKAITQVLTPVVTTSLLLICSLSFFKISQVYLFDQLAILLSIGFLLALVADLIFLPELLDKEEELV
jgi:predicted RND superfamily exporter protein